MIKSGSGAFDARDDSDALALREVARFLRGADPRALRHSARIRMADPKSFFFFVHSNQNFKLKIIFLTKNFE